MNRRELLKSSAFAAAGVATAQFLGPVKAIAADAKRIRIKDIEIFAVRLPKAANAPAASAPTTNVDPFNLVCTRLTTESGARGYSFATGTSANVEAARKVMVGEDLFALEQHLGRGLINWPHIEEAVWDAIGRIAGQPVYRLLGGARAVSQPVYLTYTWPRVNGVFQANPKQQGEWAAVVRKAGFKAMKIQIFRPNYMEDVEACREILAAGGPGFRVMVDRTAGNSGSLWDYPTGLAATKACQEAGVYWVEEPFDRNDFEGPARLAREVDILITGGEGYKGLAPYRECLTHNTYDILQPELNTVDDLVGAALQRAETVLRDHPVETDISQGAMIAGRFDFGHTLRIVVNLLENAAKYSPARAPIAIGAERRDGEIRISVSDRGPGVPISARDRIFEPFYRAPGATPDVRGAGLGLSIARRLAEAQGGALAIHERQGGGSTFVLSLPGAEAPTA